MKNFKIPCFNKNVFLIANAILIPHLIRCILDKVLLFIGVITNLDKRED